MACPPGNGWWPARGRPGSWDDIDVQATPEHIPAVPADGPPLPAALLWHGPGDGPGHFDLLLAVQPPSGDDDPCAATWRVAAGTDAGTGTAAATASDGTARVPPDFRRREARLVAERIHDHRALYLRLDAPRTLDRGRGTVVPVARGTWRPAPEGGAAMAWDDGARGTVRFVRRPDGGLVLVHATGT
jgi:hypothetical protein